MDNEKKKQLKIKGSSPVRETAGSIIRSYDDGYQVELRAIGASAVCQMYKAMATARSLFAQRGLDVSFRPGYDVVQIQGEDRTVLVAHIDVK